jgi:protein-tyrosine phosphatase
MAEGILRHKIAELGLDIITDSAGTSNFHIGEGPDHRAVKNMNRNGIDISDLRARQLKKSDFEQFDLIYVMDRSNFQNALDIARTDSHKAKVRMILDEIQPGSEREVPDPYFGGDEGFQRVYEMLDKACDKIIERLHG